MYSGRRLSAEVPSERIHPYAEKKSRIATGRWTHQQEVVSEICIGLRGFEDFQVFVGLVPLCQDLLGSFVFIPPNLWVIRIGRIIRRKFPENRGVVVFSGHRGSPNSSIGKREAHRSDFEETSRRDEKTLFFKDFPRSGRGFLHGLLVG